MAGAATSLTLDRVRASRDRIRAYVAKEMHELGADPATFAEEAIALSGIEWLERWLRPEIPAPPPLAVLFGAEWVAIEPARVALTFEPAEWMFNPFGAVYGGVTSTALDVAFGAAVHTTLPAGTGYATRDLQVRYLRAITADSGGVRVSASVVHSSRRNATVEGRVADEAGELIAAGTAGFAILRPS